MSAGVRAKGTRLFRAAANTAWVALAAGASPSVSFTEIPCPLNVRPKRYTTEQYDASCLNDAGEQPMNEKKPGEISFRTKQSDAAAFDTLKTTADAATEIRMVVLYKDGRALYGDGYLESTSDGEADNNLTAEVQHEWFFRGTEVFTWSAPAS